MAIDFNKRLQKKDNLVIDNPIEIYDSLDRKSITGPLRPTQEHILKTWYEENKDDKDLIIKLHTGAGKTLIGLLILVSKLNEKQEPCLYICPNIHLAKQVCLEAEKFGIEYCELDKSNEIPTEFTSGKSILITHAQKVFNGRSKFGIKGESISTGCVILDDSHACIDVINHAFTIEINKSTLGEAYSQIIALFENDLKEQGEGTYLDILDDDYDAMLSIPYWAWINKKSDVLKIISSNRDNKNITFTWELLKDNLEKCKAFVSNNKIEISPYYLPIHYFGTFFNAKSRILMSATTQNDSFFINGLGLSIEAVKKPLIDKSVKWAGEKMMLIPSLLHEECDRLSIIKRICQKNEKRKFGVVALVPSFRLSNFYEKNGVKVLTSLTITDELNELISKRDYSPIVICNRYDGIDLPDESCRVLIIDSLPYFNSLSDRYENLCRADSDIINKKMAQKIEQGLGRSVRGDKDYSAVIIIGADIIKFLKSHNTKDYFSQQTKTQIDIGLEISDMTKEDESEEAPMDSLISVINQCLKRDEGWKKYYIEQMNSMEMPSQNTTVYDVIEQEMLAEKHYFDTDNEKACKIIQEVIDGIDIQSEKGWYLQKLARFKHQISISESNSIQKSAFSNNCYMLKPKEGITYKKIGFISESRLSIIRRWIDKHKNYSDMMIQVDSYLENLSFGVESEKFESALKVVGEMLGFISQRPDKETRKGPDNLWCVGNNEFIMFECKSEVKQERSQIKKSEADQMSGYCGWFEEQYADASVKRYLIIPTKSLSDDAVFTHDVKIILKKGLNDFKTNIRNFFKEYKDLKLDEIMNDKLQDNIVLHNLSVEKLKSLYGEDPYKK